MNHRLISMLLIIASVSIVGFAAPLLVQEEKLGVESLPQANSPQPVSTSLERLKHMSPHELDVLRKKKRQFDELSVEKKKQLRDFHAQLQTHENHAELSAVMKRYYAWIRNLDREERNSILDLPPEQRLDQIKKIHEAKARKLFGTTGATKLPGKDVQPFIEWIKEFRSNREEEITNYFGSPEGRQKIQQWRERQARFGRDFRGPRRRGIPQTGRGNAQSGNRSAASEHRENVWFNILMEADSEFMAELIFSDIESLRAKLSQEALQILEEQNQEEQKLLVFNWAADWARQISSTRGLTDDELQRFYDSLSETQKEGLDGLSRKNWRRTLEGMYRRSQSGPGLPPASQPDLDRPAPQREPQGSGTGA